MISRLTRTPMKDLLDRIFLMTLVDLEDIREWINNKSARYGGSFPPASAIQRKLYSKGSSTKEEDLHIIEKVIDDNKTEITRQAEKLVGELLKLR